MKSKGGSSRRTARTMETIIGSEKFARALNALVGKPLWDAVAGETTGTNVIFEFGRMLRAKDVYENPTVSEEDIFVGELSITVWCSWRIEVGETRLLVGCGDIHTEGGPMQTGLQKLVGDVVTKVSVESFLDLLVFFRSGRRLRLFCDRREDDSAYGHYYLSIIGERERLLYAAVNGVITCERKPLPTREE
jgi:hypothetical protein